MKRTSIISILFLLIFPVLLQAAYLRNVPITVEQPDGTMIHCFATGDEYYNWLHDENNYTIIQNSSDGYYYYAILDDGKLLPSDLKVGSSDPLKAGLQSGLNISPAEMLQKRQAIHEQTPERPVPDHKMANAGRSEGTLNNLVIYIRFNDQDEFTRDTMDYYNWFNSTSAGTNSMYNYFKEVSYEKLEIVSWFHPQPANNIILSYQDYHDRSYFMPYNSQTNPNGYQNSDERRDREHALLVDAVEYVNDNDPVPQGLDLDYNNDGFVDNVVFIVRGAPTAWSTLLWPHRWVLYSQNVQINGKRVWDYNFQIETSLNSSGVGVLCHEMFHSLGSPDLYHYSSDGMTPVGPWDVMEQNNNPPQYMGAYMKHKYGHWIDSIPEITQTGTYTVFPLQDSVNNCWKVGSQTSDKEFFVIEYRRRDGTFEASLPSDGLLIYRIDTTAGNGNAGGPPDEVYLFRPDGSVYNNGSVSQAAFGIDHDRIEFNNETNPSCFLQNGTDGGLYISNISAIGDSMTFFVEFPGPPQADFEADITLDCPGNPVAFTDKSIGIPAEWEWSFEPATVTFAEGTDATSKDPVVVFNEEGIYSVSLTVTNEFDSDFITKTDYIEIGSRNGQFTEGFESISFSSNSWRVENPDNDVTWQIVPTGGIDNSAFSAMIDFRNYFVYGERDRLITPPLDLSAMNAAQLSFNHAYAQYNASVSDSLIIYISNDCGANWTRIFEGGEDGTGNFATHALTTEPFVPETEDDWCLQGFGNGCNVLDISEWISEEPVKIAFESFSLFGNPLYLDEIKISETVGIRENANQDVLAVYPNPATDILTVELKEVAAQGDLMIYDMQGRMLKKAATGTDAQMQIDLSEMPAGIYLLSVRTTAGTFMKKLMKN